MMAEWKLFFSIRVAMRKLIGLFLPVFLPCMFICCAFCIGGCDLAKPQNKGQGRLNAAQNAAPPQDAVPPQNVPPNPQQQQSQEDGMVTQKAQVGVGARGNYGNPVNSPIGMVTAPVSAYFKTQEKIAFDINFVRAMNEFKALNEGRVPASQAEFDEKIIRPYGIKLPPLPPNHEYFYDPSDGELKIRKPRDTP